MVILKETELEEDKMISCKRGGLNKKDDKCMLTDLLTEQIIFNMDYWLFFKLVWSYIILRKDQ